ncbi:PREDICTED: uncharacterized protein LOC105571005, partial [Vollenhovia emeryi]|uniref:uncharacterized protein LOC105571005 n=1 Tax=Vollenhovia emeryi TaxID=411798 RepID=UPI0005F4BBFF
MDKTKKVRTAHRSAFTRALNALNALRGEGSEATHQEIIVAFQLLEAKMRDLEASSQAFMHLMFDSDSATDADIQKEYDDADQYKKQFLATRLQIADYTDPKENQEPSGSTNGVPGDNKKSFKLPKIELAQFGGDVQGWLQFWNLVKSYPPTAENYSKVISSLKNRFGRDDLQIEVYVRELLQLVLQNALKSKAFSLTSLYDKIELHLRALESLGITTDKCAAMLFPLVESSLPEDVLRAWQRSSVNNAALQSGDSATSQCKDRLTQLIKFLEGEVQNELRISMAVKGFDLTTGNADSGKKRRSKTHTKEEDVPTAMGLLTTKEKDSACIFCNSNHESARCENARKMSLSERRDHAKKQNVCFNCLKAGHNFKQCRSKVSCSWCSMRHVLLMCPKIEKKDKDSKVDSKSQDSEKANTIVDTGSQKSYVTKEAAEHLDYEPIAEQTMTHSLFGGQKTDAVQHKKYRIRLSSLDNKYCCNFIALDQAVICERVPLIKIGEWDRELEKLDIDVSDRHSKRESISVLIGADVAGKLYTGRVYVLKGGLVAIETCLGWTVMGKVPESKTSESAATTAISLFINKVEIADMWSLDVLGIRDPIETKTQKEKDDEMQEAFLKTVRVNEEGRYEIQLPWLPSHPALPRNKETAMRRLQSTERKLKADNLYAEYDAVFNEWLAEGIIERVPVQEEDDGGYYLPHRHVVKEGSTTRIRPVFDASAKERTSPSLNECLHKGPNLIELIASILLRFRENKIGVIADIKRAFLQISIDKRDRDFLRFLWYDAGGNIIVFRHCRVVFGVTSSPFILSAIRNFHLNNYAKSDNDVSINSKRLLESFYVDNAVTSVNTREDLNNFILDAKRLMNMAGFDLRGWEYSDDNSQDNQTVVLGVTWDKRADTLAIKIPDFPELHDSKMTKRKILSSAHRIFDPLGFVCPVMLCPRILLQETWSENLKWDDEVPDKLKNRFSKWLEDLKELNKIRITRCILGQISESDNVSLHIFCDASKDAYATVIYIRVENFEGVKVHFVQAKTRVAPARKGNTDARTSIPRLELLAATIGARLARNVLDALHFKTLKLFYWTDSSTVLAWIQRECNWATFVYNRIKEIRMLSDPACWYHVQGRLNPADLPSRGCTAKQIMSARWWEGPVWLYETADKWPMCRELSCDEDEISKELKRTAINKKSVCTLVALEGKGAEENEFLSRFSNFAKMIRVFA